MLHATVLGENVFQEGVLSFHFLSLGSCSSAIRLLFISMLQLKFTISVIGKYIYLFLPKQICFFEFESAQKCINVHFSKAHVGLPRSNVLLSFS